MTVEFWEYEGEPTDEEIQLRKSYDKDNYDHLAVRPECPTCGSKKTMWIRQQWCVCFDCESSFTTQPQLSQEDSDFWSQFDV